MLPKNKKDMPLLPLKVKVWSVKHEEYEGECGVAIPPVIRISHLVEDKIAALMVEFPHCEWLAYLVGKGMVVNDIIVPKQEASAGHVEVTEYPQGITDIIGVVHSHHTLGNFHSGTDNEYLVGNHNISIVATTDGKFKAKMRVTVPCGKLLVREAEVEISRYDVTEFVNLAKLDIAVWQPAPYNPKKPYYSGNSTEEWNNWLGEG